MRKIAFALSMACAASVHAESASTIRSVDMLAQSQSDAAKVASLPENTAVDVLRRVGAWSEVKTDDGKSGWVRMTALKFSPASGAQASNSGKSGGNALTALLGSGRTSSSATVTTGVRGLTEEDLQKAQANVSEFEKARKFAVTAQAARAFAGSSKLEANKVDYLPDAAASTGRSRKSRSEDQ